MNCYKAMKMKNTKWKKDIDQLQNMLQKINQTTKNAFFMIPHIFEV